MLNITKDQHPLKLSFIFDKRSCFYSYFRFCSVFSLCLSPQIRTVCYGSQLAGGFLSRQTETDASFHRLGKSLLLFSAQLSKCRTVLRLFDDLSMLAYSHSYGFGAGVSRTTTRCSIVSSLIVLPNWKQAGMDSHLFHYVVYFISYLTS